MAGIVKVSLHPRKGFAFTVENILKNQAAETGYLVQAVDTFGYEVPKLRRPISRQILGIVHAPHTNLIMNGFADVLREAGMDPLHHFIFRIEAGKKSTASFSKSFPHRNAVRTAYSPAGSLSKSRNRFHGCSLLVPLK